jgi:hypothetical protein
VPRQRWAVQRQLVMLTPPLPSRCTAAVRCRSSAPSACCRCRELQTSSFWLVPLLVQMLAGAGAPEARKGLQRQRCRQNRASQGEIAQRACLLLQVVTNRILTLVGADADQQHALGGAVRGLCNQQWTRVRRWPRPAGAPSATKCAHRAQDPEPQTLLLLRIVLFRGGPGVPSATRCTNRADPACQLRA